jgi:small redox-active disulfide protein 2
MIKIEVFGTGCAKCNRLEKNVHKAVKESGIKAKIVKVSDISEIMDRGVIMTPALVINGEAKSTGRVPSVDEIKKLLMS